MAKYDYNLIVIGAGSAGLVSSYIAASIKAKVALIEKHKMGGDCLNTGCVPSKALLRSAKMLSYAARANEFGFKQTQVTFDFAEVMERVQRVIKDVEPHDSIERYSKLGVECITGDARIISPHEVSVNGKTLTTRAIIVATGASPLVPNIPGLGTVDYLTSDTVWNLRELPKKLTVVGGGPIGSELAQAFSRLGAEVTQVQAGPQILVREDEEVIETVTRKFEHEGIRVLVNHRAKAFEGNTLICEHNGQDVRVEFDRVLLALGRKAHVKGFGLEELGVKMNPQGTVSADPFLETNIPGIYVCGDVTGPYQFTHVAAHQASYASLNALFAPIKRFKADYRVIPWTTFTDPEVARVGLNEKDAKAANIPYETAVFELKELDRAIADNETEGFIKVLTVPGKDQILGVTIVGTHAGDLIAEYVLAMKENIGLNKILSTIHIYPTLGELNKYVAGEWKRAHIPAGAMSFLNWFHNFRR